MTEKEKLAYESTMTAEEAARHLEALAKGLREHVMIIESGDTSIAIDVAREVQLELDAGASQKKSQVGLKIAWHPEEGTEIRPPMLKILPRERYSLDADSSGRSSNGHRGVDDEASVVMDRESGPARDDDPSVGGAKVRGRAPAAIARVTTPRASSAKKRRPSAGKRRTRT